MRGRAIGLWGAWPRWGEVLNGRDDASGTGCVVVVTRRGNGVDAPAPRGARRRTTDPRSGLPGARAIVGGLLVAVAGVSTFAAWRQASGAADGSYAVAARPILPGQSLTADDVRFEPIDLPARLSAAAFTDASGIEGRVALGPIGEGELVQLGQVSDPGQAGATAELSFSIARDRAVDGRLRSGDLVDVFVTDDGGTAAVAEGIRIVDVAAHDSGSFATTGEVTITVTIADPSLREPLIHAVREGEVTLVRSTHMSHEAG
ncbi:MAG TPA: SAF domain-containing protein [Acidimicrobiales bacterium]|nr:SAF domain-containing protein [Acidimicrobiales bacterium]